MEADMNTESTTPVLKKRGRPRGPNYEARMKLQAQKAPKEPVPPRTPSTRKKIPVSKWQPADGKYGIEVVSQLSTNFCPSYEALPSDNIKIKLRKKYEKKTRGISKTSKKSLPGRPPSSRKKMAVDKFQPVIGKHALKATSSSEASPAVIALPEISTPVNAVTSLTETSTPVAKPRRKSYLQPKIIMPTGYSKGQNVTFQRPTVVYPRALVPKSKILPQKSVVYENARINHYAPPIVHILSARPPSPSKNIAAIKSIIGSSPPRSTDGNPDVWHVDLASSEYVAPSNSLSLVSLPSSSHNDMSQSNPFQVPLRLVNQNGEQIYPCIDSQDLNSFSTNSLNHAYRELEFQPNYTLTLL